MINEYDELRHALETGNLSGVDQLKQQNQQNLNEVTSVVGPNSQEITDPTQKSEANQQIQEAQQRAQNEFFQKGGSMKLNSNTIILNQEERKAIEDIVVKIASDNSIENVESVNIIISEESGHVGFKVSMSVDELTEVKDLGKNESDVDLESKND